MKVLMISSDPKVLGDIATKQRMEKYRQLVDELYTVVIAGRFNVVAFFNAYREGSKILRERGASDFLITAQDPAERWIIGWFLSRKFRVPLEVQVHTDLKSPYLLKESFKNRIRLFIARFLLPRASCIRVVSRRIEQSLTEWIPALGPRITVLPIYVDIEKFHLLPHREDSGEFLFLVVSRLTREKNVALALDAFAEIHTEFPQTKLHIVGDGPLRRQLEARALKYKHAKESIVFVGWQEDVASYYQNAQCYLLTSNYEGYGRTVVEALAAGVPVIMTDVGVAGDIVQNEQSGLVVPVGDKLELVKAMRRLRGDPYLLKSLCENIRKVKRANLTREAYLETYKRMWQMCSTKKK